MLYKKIVREAARLRAERKPYALVISTEMLVDIHRSPDTGRLLQSGPRGHLLMGMLVWAFDDVPEGEIVALDCEKMLRLYDDFRHRYGHCKALQKLRSGGITDWMISTVDVYAA